MAIEYSIEMAIERENKRINSLPTSTRILQMSGISNVKTLIVSIDETANHDSSYQTTYKRPTDTTDQEVQRNNSCSVRDRNRSL
jgi:hypothetical protein